MSRFKFACSCGKRLAAYDWMVGRLLTCPKCGRTLTVPTPFQAEDQLNKMIEGGYAPERRQIGKPIEKASRFKWLVVVAAVLGLTGALVLAGAIGWFLHRFISQ